MARIHVSIRAIIFNLWRFRKSSFFHLIIHNLLYLISNDISEKDRLSHVIYFYDESFNCLSGKIKNISDFFIRVFKVRVFIHTHMYTKQLKTHGRTMNYSF